MILGIDHGYSYIKTSKGIVFPSTITKGEDIDFNKDTIRIRVDDCNYTVGNNNGQQSADINKISSEITKVCTYAAIGKSAVYPMIEVDIVVGLPVGYYGKQKDEFKSTLLGYGRKDIILNGFKQSIKIRRVEVFPQSAGVVFTNPEQYKGENTLVIDIGGMTVDVSYFRGMRLEKYSTYTSGMLKLYTKLAQVLNSKFDVNYKTSDIEEILNKNKCSIDGQPYNISFLDEIIDEHVGEFMSNIKTEYPIRTVDSVVLIGGGGKQLKNNIEKIVKSVKLDADAQFANAMHFYNIGRMKFHE
jgi:plasmid segregation protein ParM